LEPSVAMRTLVGNMLMEPNLLDVCCQVHAHSSLM
jgi:hypothetical protein